MSGPGDPRSDTAGEPASAGGARWRILYVIGALLVTVWLPPRGSHGQSPGGLVREALTDWAMSGAVSTTAFRVSARLHRPSERVGLAYGLRPDLSDARMTALRWRAGSVNDLSPSMLAHDLRPGTRYYWAVVADDRLDTAHRGSTRTAGVGAHPFRVALAGDATLASEHPVFDAIARERPAFFLMLGDFFDASVVYNDFESFRSVYRQHYRSEAIGRLLRDVPIAHMWDDHDYGWNNADRDYVGRQASRSAWQEHTPHHDLAAYDGTSRDIPIYRAFTRGRVRFILTDLRSERDPSDLEDKPGKSMMGTDQRLWFENEIRWAHPRFPLVVWVSSVPWTASAEQKADHWGGYHAERTALASMFRREGVDNLIVVSADAHMLAIDDGRNGDFAPGGGAPIPQVVASALDGIPKFKGGPYSHGYALSDLGDGQFALLDVADIGGPRVCINVTGYRVDGSTGATRALPEPRWSRCFPATSTTQLSEAYLPSVGR